MLRQRVTSAAILVSPIGIVVAAGQPWIALGVAIVVALAVTEVYRLLREAGYPSLPLLGTVLAAAVALEAAAPAQLADKAALLLAVGIVVVALGAFARPDPREGLGAWVATVFGALYVAQLGFVSQLGTIAPPLAPGAPVAAWGSERGWLILLVLTVWAYDTGAYFVGRRFGRRRFLIHLSASKTYEGAAGGTIAATVVALGCLVGLGQPPWTAIVLGPLLSAAAQAGDMAESMLKRAASAKDSGTLIPGHGGILDRVDSFLFAAPILALYVVALVR